MREGSERGGFIFQRGHFRYRIAGSEVYWEVDESYFKLSSADWLQPTCYPVFFLSNFCWTNVRPKLKSPRSFSLLGGCTTQSYNVYWSVCETERRTIK